jgi:hypothetical protein
MSQPHASKRSGEQHELDKGAEPINVASQINGDVNFSNSSSDEPGAKQGLLWVFFVCCMTVLIMVVLQVEGLVALPTWLHNVWKQYHLMWSKYHLLHVIQ